MRLRSWSKAGRPEETAFVLQEMQDLHHRGLLPFKINSGGTTTISDDDQNHHYPPDDDDNNHVDEEDDPHWDTAVLEAWKQSKHPMAAEHAEQCLIEMIQCSLRGQNNTLVKPLGTDAFNVVLAIYSEKLERLGYMRNRNEYKTTVQKIESIFQQVKKRFQPDVVMYNTMMHMWSKQQQFFPEPEKVEALFQELLSSTSPLVKPRYAEHVVRLQAWSHAGNPEMTKTALKDIMEACDAGVLDEKPGCREFSTVLQAWMRSKRSNAADQAEQGLRRMQQLAQSGRYDCHPNAYTYSAVLGCMARLAQSTPQVGPRAMRLLEEMTELSRNEPEDSLRKRELLPHALTYLDVARALVRSPSSMSTQMHQEWHKKALQRVLVLLQEREPLSFGPNLKKYMELISKLGGLVRRCCANSAASSLWRSKSYATNNELFAEFDKLKEKAQVTTGMKLPHTYYFADDDVDLTDSDSEVESPVESDKMDT
ncbi:hypothetical protein ACA910_021617 [Epithemia clementina (nom. ined.)]